MTTPKDAALSIVSAAGSQALSSSDELINAVLNLSHAQNLDEVMSIVRTAARRLTGADGATFVLRDEDRCYYADEDAISPLWKGQRFPMPTCISGWVMLNGTSAAIEDIYSDARIPADAYKPTFVKSLAMVPIRKNSPIGAIGNYWAKRHAPTADEVRLLQALADATSVALQNVELRKALIDSFQQREKNILDNIPDGVITINSGGIIENYNRASERIFGYTAEEAVGQSINMLMPSDTASKHNGYISNYLFSGRPHIIGAPGREVEALRKDGQTFPVEISVTEVRDGSARFFCGIIRDVTERRDMETKLKRAKEQAEKATQAKSEFLANMSHELRTPLNSIIGMTRLLYESEGLEEDHREMARVSFRSAERLLDIVNDILDLSKIEAGEMNLEKITFALTEVLDNVLEIMAPLSSQKGLVLNCDMPSAGDTPYLVGDPLRLGRIMINLVGNAIKYTSDGSVSIKISCSAPDNGLATVHFSVMDTGMGIAPDKVTHIFEKFMQADSSITRQFGGTGLGLHITKQLVERMGGNIGVESAPGKGSHFWFKIPFPVSDARLVVDKTIFQRQRIDRLPPSQRKHAEMARILVGEDHELNQAFMKRLLHQMGFRDYDIANNGQQALDALENKAYDLILMDCHMPLLSGYDAVRAIRAREHGTGRHIPIIAMTADAMTGTRARCIAAGMDDYISKPMNPDHLHHLLSRWITFPGEQETLSAPAAAARETPSLREFATSDSDLKHLVDLFIRQSDETLKILRENCTNGEGNAWTDAAHKLKGGALAAKAKHLASICETAQQARDASTVERLALLREIEAAYSDVKKQLLDTLK